MELGREGASVWACDVLERELGETRRAVGERAGGPCRVAVVDVTDPRRVSAFVDELVATEGRLDVLVNCAGGVVGQTMKPVEEVSEEAWRVDLRGEPGWGVPLHAGRRSRHEDARARQHREHLVGRGPFLQPQRDPGYASAKAGLIGFTRQTARELGGSGSASNCVAPGFVRSNPASERRWQAMGEAGQRRLLDSIALRRLGEPEDIARAVLFFASDDARYVTGQTISVDGGHWMLG